MPKDPKAGARTIWYDEFADTLLTACGGKIVFNRLVGPRFLGQPGDEEVARKAECDELPPLLDYLERVIPASGFLVEDRLTLADSSIASPFATLDHAGTCIDGGRHPRLKAYVDAILARPSFAPLVAGEKAFLAQAA